MTHLQKQTERHERLPCAKGNRSTSRLMMQTFALNTLLVAAMHGGLSHTSAIASEIREGVQLPKTGANPEPQAEAGAHCARLEEPQAVQSWLSGKKRVVFFASWCGSCKAHLEEAKADPTGTAVAVVFDDVPKAERALNRLGMKNACIASEQLAKEQKVEALPAERTIPQMAVNGESVSPDPLPRHE